MIVNDYVYSISEFLCGSVCLCIRFSSLTILSIAIPAEADRGFALKVPGWCIFVPFSSASIEISFSISFFPTSAPPGSPPATIFASVVKSGVTL